MRWFLLLQACPQPPMFLVQLPSFLPALLPDSGQGNPGLLLGGCSACHVLCHQLPCGSAWAAGWAWVPISLQSSVLQGGWSLACPVHQLCTAPGSTDPGRGPTGPDTHRVSASKSHSLRKNSELSCVLSHPEQKSYRRDLHMWRFMDFIADLRKLVCLHLRKISQSI